jgi:uncharacterized repeat protein (TIGR01451 family)
MVKRLALPVLSTLAVLTASPAFATFHLMKIEQAIGGVGGDTAQQAVQLRMRFGFQNELDNAARLVAWDAAGTNPVVLIEFPSDVAVGLQGRRVLVVSSAFATAQTAITGDFTMTNTIPSSYLAAGRLTFEDVGGNTIYWSLAWGGGSYTGSNMGSATNDPDGNFGPQFGLALPSTGTTALLFSAPDVNGGAASTTNAADYSVTPGAAVFTNNADQSGTVVSGGTADLALSKTDSPDPVTVLQPLGYTIVVSSLGPSTATSVMVVDPLPAGTVFQNASGEGWTCNHSAGTVTCTRPTLPVGAAPNIVITVTAPATPGTISNTATVSAAETDPVPGNNNDTEDTTVNTLPPQADLSIVKTDGGVEGRWGQPLTYTLTITNAGPSGVAGATVTDNFPAGLSNVSWTCAASAGSTCPASGSGNIAASVDLLPSGTATFTATGTVDPGTLGPLVNTATIAPPGSVTDPNPGNNSSTETTVVGPIQFFTLAPCRLADTRTTPGPSGGPALQANSTRTFPVGGLCNVPADARAVAITLTVVQETEAGNLRMFPTGEPVPTASVINFVAGLVRANNAIIKLGAGGQIDVRCDMVPGSSGTTHFLFDTTGYFR